MTNETLLDIEQAELIYSMEETTATIYGSQRDINRVSDAAYKAADAYERAYQESGAYEDKKQSLHWRVAAEKCHHKHKRHTTTNTPCTQPSHRSSGTPQQPKQTLSHTAQSLSLHM